MKNTTAYSIYPLGDNALVISLGETIDEETSGKVRITYQALLKSKDQAWVDIIPAYTSITIVFSPIAGTSIDCSFAKRKEAVEMAIMKREQISGEVTRTAHIPVCYASPYSLDGETLARDKKMKIEELVALHTGQSYRVYMMGFLPGFPYMGVLPSVLATPRLLAPRQQVPAGSVGIAGSQTGIYPLMSPGGWNIIGRTPLKLFNPKQQDPIVLRPGDKVIFYSITVDEFQNFDSELYNPFAT